MTNYIGWSSKLLNQIKIQTQLCSLDTKEKIKPYLQIPYNSTEPSPSLFAQNPIKYQHILKGRLGGLPF